jgi:hypothetical protein
MSVPYDGQSNKPNVPGVRGSNSAGGDGIRGKGRRGVVGESKEFQGVFGHSDENAGVVGESQGMHAVFGITHAGRSAGVYGTNDTRDGRAQGVLGESQAGDGVVGRGRRGVVGESKEFQGVFGHSDENAGVVGESTGFDGIFGISHSAEHAGVSGHNDQGGFAGFFDGKVTVVGTLTATNDIVLSGADCAEDFPVADRVPDPGTVMVIESEGRLRECHEPYDPKVAGVISGAGGTRPGIVLGRTAPDSSRAPLAMIGKVYCKVDATVTAVAVGDLLTTSSTPGHAMKAADRSRSFGSIIGKALGALSEGRGLVPILVAMQ